MADILEVYDIKNNTTEDIGDKKSRANVAAAFNTSKTYAINDLTVYNGELYKFTAAHSAGAWDASHVAKTTIENEFIKKSGDIMTGSLFIQNDRANSFSTSLPSNNAIVGFACLDVNGNYYGYVNSVQYADTGIISQQISARRALSSTTYIDNSLKFNIDNNGNCSIGMSHPAAWRNALDNTPWIDRSTTITLSASGCTFDNSAVLRRFGKIVTMSYFGTITFNAANTYYGICNIPSGYKPIERLCFYAASYASATYKGDCRFSFVNDTTTLYTSSEFSGAKSTVGFVASWITADS